MVKDKINEIKRDKMLRSNTGLLDASLIKEWQAKHWYNISDFCNRKTHPDPTILSYRKYRRGKSRCLVCGAKIGKIKCVRTSASEQVVKMIFAQPFLAPMLANKNTL